MDTKEIRQLAIAGARAEITRLQRFLAEVEGENTPTPPTPAKRGRGKRNLTDAQRAEISRRMKAIWAAKRKRKGA
jgi:hypothetical protein